MRALKQSLLYLLLTVAALIMLAPILYAISVSFMPPHEIEAYPPTIIPSGLYLENYARVLQSVPVGRYILNSFLIASGVTLGQIITASLAAYSFAFMNWKGKALLFSIYMSTMMVPWEVTLIPNYLTIRSLRLVDTYPGLMLPFLATAFGVFLLRQFFLQIPRELEDAARIDGCGRFRFLWMIVLPLSRPGLITLGAYTFLATWNQYLWPLLLTNTREMRTVQIGIRFLMNEEARQYGVVMAGVVIFMIPALLMLLLGYRYLVRGMMAGAVKG